MQILAGIAAAQAEVRQGWAGASLTRCGPAPSSPAWATVLGPPAGPQLGLLAGPQQGSPGWAAAWFPGWAKARSPVWASSASRPASSPAPARLTPAGRHLLPPGWAGSGGSGLAGISSQGVFANTGWAGLYCSGWARQGSLAQAGLYLWQAGLSPCRPSYSSPGPIFTPSGTYSSSSIDSHTPCQSWDASRLGLARSPPTYAVLGTPLGSDQHIHPLLVSLILRRRIRLMTWGS
jgi:hypothetical protein